jgi:hypothetical protein
MKNNTRTLFLLLGVLIVSMYSCELTDDGLEDPRDSFVGQWTCTEYENGQSQISYPVTIEKDAINSDWVLLNNFGYIGVTEKPPYGEVSGDYITIPSQKVCYDESVTVDGNGHLTGKDEMEWEYNLEVGGDSYHYTAIFTRQ